MDGNHDDDLKEVKPPAGLLAERELAKQEDAEKKELSIAQSSPLDSLLKSEHKSPAILPVDPNYKEPTQVAVYRSLADAVSRGMAAACDNEDLELVKQFSMQRQSLINFLLQRIVTLESVLLPFGQAAMTMANSQMCLAALKRGDEPGGGMWVSNPPDGIQLMPNQGLFFAACDALGRQRVHDHMCDTLDKMRAMTQTVAERDKHVEDGGTVH